ncbi:MAG: DUF368 domain-containing protein, partial [Verrucomicrobiales bacterium]|nr:DUF368 domain-containing protein [Verrucomicrobiales bacterium]
FGGGGGEWGGDGDCGGGVVLSIVSLAKVLEWLFERHEVVVWAFFFGLILASIPYVFRAVKRWGISTWLSLLVGVLVAGGIAFLPRAGADESAWYVFICGMAAISSMIVPGVSGSFVLLLMGNYFLVLGAISGLDFKILVPFGVGCVVGIVGLSHLLSWVFKKHHDVAVALITGFIAGSLLVIWPWKDTKFDRDVEGVLLVKTAERAVEARPGELAEVKAALAEGEELVVAGYENWALPAFGEKVTWMALGALAFGVILVVLMERAGSKKPASVQ